MEEQLTTPVTIYNANSFVYVTAQVAVDNMDTKADELTLLLKSLLHYGIFDSIESAQENNVPQGTFIIVDDPSTDEVEFKVEIVPFYLPKKV